MLLSMGVSLSGKRYNSVSLKGIHPWNRAFAL